MNEYYLSGETYAEMIKGGAAQLGKHRTAVNDLNVFPVPDGDTGDNMFMTINAGVKRLEKEGSGSLGDVARAISGGMLHGARGNSGSILSRIFAGISKGFDSLETADIGLVKKAFSMGVAEAYNSVETPVEGTILTVYKDAVNYANSGSCATLAEYFEDFTQELGRSLERTPTLLKVLMDAGVVDSGGAGLVYIAEGMKKALSGEITDYNELRPSSAKDTPDIDLDLFTEDSRLTYGYCTEFLLRLQRAKTDIDCFDTAAFTAELKKLGNSVVAFSEGSIVKVHIHTEAPGEILNFAQKYGEFLTLKIENMSLQHSEVNSGSKAAEHGTNAPGSSPLTVPEKKSRPLPRKKYGIVSVAAGSGIIKLFEDLGCDTVVNGGQSMNPSVDDFINAFEGVNAETIFVFPNNGNIYMTACQAAEFYKEAAVKVLRTKTIGEGYAGVSMINLEAESADDIITELNDCIQGVVTGLVSKASRDAGGSVAVKKGDFIGFAEDIIYVDSPSRTAAAETLAEKLGLKSYDIAILIFGKDVPEEEADSVCSSLSGASRRTEIIKIDGGQPIYDYIIILE